MEKRPIYKVDAFTTTPLEGNPAGVMPFAQGLSSEKMRSVAREMNVSETAFVLPSDKADHQLRFFTPTQEVPFCGHALLGSIAVLVDLGMAPTDPYSDTVTIETRLGVFSVYLVDEGDHMRVEMDQAPPEFKPCQLDLAELADILGCHDEDLQTGLPIELAYTGLWHLIVPLADHDVLDNLMPDYRRLAELNRVLDVDTTHLFVEDKGVFHCRDFAPASGIDEDPVTGSASGALGGYLLKNELIKPHTLVELHQGYACGRPGIARVVVDGEPGNPTSVTVGGNAVITLRGEMLTGMDNGW